MVGNQSMGGDGTRGEGGGDGGDPEAHANLNLDMATESSTEQLRN